MKLQRLDGPSATMREALAGYCTAMWELTGDARWRRAAGVLTGAHPGRREVDDEAALRYARGLMSAGVAKSPYRASAIAAELFAPPHQVETCRDRLRRKLRR